MQFCLELFRRQGLRHRVQATVFVAVAVFGGPAPVAGVQRTSCPTPPPPELSEIPEDLYDGVLANTYRRAQARERFLLGAEIPGVLRDTVSTEDPRLRLVTGTGETISLVDGTPFVENARPGSYSYRDYIAELDVHFIELQYYEGGAYLLVDRCTGEKAKVQARPVLSPDERRFVTVSVDLVSHYRPNAIQIWLHGRTYELEFSWTPEWGPASAEWLGPDAIRVSRVVVDGRFQYQRAGFVVLRYLEGEWRVVEERP